MNDEHKLSTSTRLDSEWLTLVAFRELILLASSGDPNKSSYQKALQIAGEICPEILGDSSLLRAGQLSSTAKELIQRARLESRKREEQVTALSTAETDLEYNLGLVSVSQHGDATDQLRQKIRRIEYAIYELSGIRVSENQAISRDYRLFEHELPTIGDGHGYADYQLVDDQILRVRALHPDKAEEILGADLIYERHHLNSEKVEIVMIQYKIWEKQKLYLNDDRMKAQIKRMEKQTCLAGLCTCNNNSHPYRFPYCCSFLRPTDKLQRPDQKLRTSGEHIPICRIEALKSLGPLGAELLEYDKIRSVSLSHTQFESLFRTGKIGSRVLSHQELKDFYKEVEAIRPTATLLVHGQNIQIEQELTDHFESSFEDM